jgi:hypothetical protein
MKRKKQATAHAGKNVGWKTAMAALSAVILHGTPAGAQSLNDGEPSVPSFGRRAPSSYRQGTYHGKKAPDWRRIGIPANPGGAPLPPQKSPAAKKHSRITPWRISINPHATAAQYEVTRLDTANALPLLSQNGDGKETAVLRIEEIHREGPIIGKTALYSAVCRGNNGKTFKCFISTSKRDTRLVLEIAKNKLVKREIKRISILVSRSGRIKDSSRNIIPLARMDATFYLAPPRERRKTIARLKRIAKATVPPISSPGTATEKQQTRDPNALERSRTTRLSTPSPTTGKAESGEWPLETLLEYVTRFENSSPELDGEIFFPSEYDKITERDVRDSFRILRSYAKTSRGKRGTLGKSAEWGESGTLRIIGISRVNNATDGNASVFAKCVDKHGNKFGCVIESTARILVGVFEQTSKELSMNPLEPVPVMVLKIGTYLRRNGRVKYPLFFLSTYAYSGNAYSETPKTKRTRKRR